MDLADAQVRAGDAGQPDSARGEIMDRLAALLPQLSADEAPRRVALVLNLAVAALAGLETRLGTAGAAGQEPFDLEIRRIVDVLVGALGAPSVTRARAQAGPGLTRAVGQPPGSGGPGG